MIKALLEEGVPQTRIADQLRIDRKTVARYASDETLPKYPRVPRASLLDPIKDYLRQRLAQYDLTTMKHYAEIQPQGYRGSYVLVQRYVKQIRPPETQLWIGARLTQAVLLSYAWQEDSTFVGRRRWRKTWG